MRGEFMAVWPETWRHIWVPLAVNENAPDELWSELYREFAPIPKRPKEPTTPISFGDDGALRLTSDIAARDEYTIALERYSIDRSTYEEAVESSGTAEPLFHILLNTQVASEESALAFLGRAFSVVQAFDDVKLDTEFVCLVRSFIDTFNLRYELRDPFLISATLSGLFANLVTALRDLAVNDTHLETMFAEFEDAMCDSTRDPTSGRIKSCLQKQFNLTEALGQRYPGVDADTLGGMCNQITSWPHVTVKEALKKLYGLRSDFPGIGHGGNPEAARRELDMRDLLAISVVLMGFAPYLTHDLDMSLVRGGA